MYHDRRCILIVDDEVKMLRGLGDFLTASGFYVMTAPNGEAALDLYYKNSTVIDLILLDVMIPVMGGLQVLAELREYGSFTPVILLTAKSQEYDQLEGFKQGADDYVTKPFSPTVLLARIESILKRVGKSSLGKVSLGNLHIDVLSRSASHNGVALDLTRREFDLLLFFMSNETQTFSREQLLNSVWGYDFDGDVRTVDTHVKQLRIKLGENADYIKTVYRIGYKFEV